MTIQADKIVKRIEPQKNEKPDPSIGLVNQPLIKTKSLIPPLRDGFVSRPHLFEKLEQGAQRALTLISAPAGYGKTTLLSEWITTREKKGASLPLTVCWLSLDPGDNDPIRFLSYLTATLDKVNPEATEGTRSLLQSSQSFNPQIPISVLINNLQEIPHSVSLILDDYQFINNQTIHNGITFLLEHIPPNVHLVIATRSDPPLPIARLRSRDQLVELRANDLRFSTSETTTFLKTIFNLSLTPDQISDLEKRTEGWIAGLQMAAISMQGRADISQFIDAFSGSHRFIMDYLTEEALNRQPQKTKEFLLYTSILERLSGPLCDYILAGEFDNEANTSPSINDLSFTQGESQNLLNELERSNLFIIPTDEARVWYRYHHLFADILRTRLKQISPESIPVLHTRASEWFEKNGWIEESIEHSLIARNWDNASRLIDIHIYRYLENGQMTTVMKWIEGFPKDIIYRYPKLCVKVAEVYAQSGLIDQIDPLLDRAEESISVVENHPSDSESVQIKDLTREDINMIRAMSMILRGLKSVCTGNPNHALDLIHQALTDIPEMESEELAVLFWVEGWAYRSLGNPDRALASLIKGTEFVLKTKRLFRDIWTDLAIVTRLVGKLPQALEIFNNSLQIAAERGIQNQGNLSRDESFLSLIYLEQNNLNLAYAHANQAIAYTQWWPSHNILAIAYTNLALILLARNDLDGSLLALQKADRERKNRIMTPFVHGIVDIAWVRIWLKRGEWVLLDKWSGELYLQFQNKLESHALIDEYLESQLIMLVRVWIEKTRIDKKSERYEKCLNLLAKLEINSKTAGRVNSLIEILLLIGFIRFSQSEVKEAIDCLDKCLAMAEPGGYMRIFLDTGEPLRAFLSAYLQESNPVYKPFVLKILKEFDESSFLEKPQSEPQNLITSREREVLLLIAKGYSNKQIAEELVLSEGTVKFHVHNLLEKLQADNRTRIIVRAKDLNLIQY